MRAVIADYESSERATLVELCQAGGGIGDLIVVQSGMEALQQIRVNRPDVALVACELQDMTGFDVLRALDDEERPATIMVAPDNRYEAEALSSAVTDYLTRPISPDRLALALTRACTSTQRASKHSAVRKAPAAYSNRHTDSLPLGQGDRLLGERAGRIHFFSPTDVEYIEADSNYLNIRVGHKFYLNRDSLTRLAVVLENVGFVRISRAVLLNMQRVSFAEREGGGVLAFVLESGARVVSSTGFRLEAGVQLRVARTRRARRKIRST